MNDSRFTVGKVLMAIFVILAAFGVGRWTGPEDLAAELAASRAGLQTATAQGAEAETEVLACQTAAEVALEQCAAAKTEAVAEIAQLTASVMQLTTENEQLAAENAQFRRRHAELAEALDFWRELSEFVEDDRQCCMRRLSGREGPCMYRHGHPGGCEHEQAGGRARPGFLPGRETPFRPVSLAK